MKFNITVDNVGKVNHERAWVLAFDPGSSTQLKAALIKELRHEIEVHDQHMDDKRRDACSWLDNSGLPTGMTVAFVMTGGFIQQDRDIYSYMSTTAPKLAERFVLLGYSTGNHSQRSFSDGTEMWGKIFIPKQDVELLRDNRSSPLLLLDWCKNSGATYVGLGEAMKKQLKYEGPIFQVCEISNGASGKGSIETWSNGREESSKRSPPIYTEEGGPIQIVGSRIAYLSEMVAKVRKR